MHARRIASAALALVLATVPAYANDDPGVSEEAKKHFRAGVALLQDPDGTRWEEAYREFKAAYDLSASPKILGNIGLSAMKLERDGEAIEAYSRYLREVKDIDPEEREQIVRDLQTLTVTVTRVALRVEPATAEVTLIDQRLPVRGEMVHNVYPMARGSGPLELGIRPGHHRLVARAAGFEEAVWEFEAYGGSKEAHSFTLVPSPVPGPGAQSLPSKAETKSGAAPWPWIVMGAGGAALAAGTVTGILALGKERDLEKLCGGDVCPPGSNLDSEKSGARALVTATDVLLLSGAVVAAGGLTWFLVDRAQSKEPSMPRAAALCTGSGCSAQVRWTF